MSDRASQGTPLGMLSPGQTIDRYTVESVIGHGGTAVVYLVRHNKLNSTHALKVLSLSSGAIRQRLLREGQVQAALQHANIVTVTDVLDVGGNPGLLMEHVDGPALDVAMKRYKITLPDALTLFRGIVSGVRAAHRHGLVHRDLKPANVLLFRSPEGFVPKVTDFGLAKVLVGQGAELGQTRQGIAMGTPAYMAPEQIRDARAVDQRADIFSLGCILYELATRARAFPGDQALEIYNNIVAGRYTPPEELMPDLPDSVINAIDGCLVLEREARIPDCETLLRVLAGRQVWDIEDHPIPDEVLPTEEVPRDAPDIPLAQKQGTPASAPPRTPRPPITPSEPLTDADVVDVSDGTLGGDTPLDGGEERERRSLGVVMAIAAGAALVVLLLVAGVGVGIGWVLGFGTGTVEGPGLAEGVVDSVDVEPTPVEAVEPVPEPDPTAPAAGGSTEAQPVAPKEPRTAPEINDDPPQPSVVSPPPAPVAASVKLLSVPRTAELWVDSVDLARTPKKVSLPLGEHTVRMRSGEREATFRILVSPSGANTWCYSFPEESMTPGKCP